MLKRRDQIAAMMTVTDVKFDLIEDAAAWVGAVVPDARDYQAIIELDAKVHAKIKVIRADALIAELGRTATNPEENKAHDSHPFTVWNGGDCPVLPSRRVEVQLRDRTRFTGIASGFYWRVTGSSQDVVGFRIVEDDE